VVVTRNLRCPVSVGLTIERKRPGRKPLDPDNHVGIGGVTGQAGATAISNSSVDRVEITKVPAAANPSAAATRMAQDAAASIVPVSSSKIPAEYYASQALSGAFLAEQIRQQQLAAALQSRLTTSTTSTADSRRKGKKSKNTVAAMLAESKAHHLSSELTIEPLFKTDTR